MPVEPTPSRWVFPTDPPRRGEVVGVGADLEPGTLLLAYRSGLFPMPSEDGVMAWWSPDPRGILPLDGLRVSRSLRKATRRFEVRVDTAFAEVVEACADPARNGRWITDEIAEAYLTLHTMGWAHSVEAWSLEDGSLAGGLYGVATGGLFAGESMFHRQTDASKVALVGLVDLLGGAAGASLGRLLDVQWRTEHLGSLGVTEIRRTTYVDLLAHALELPLPPALA
jgi:leucyl/phenylalanyl-tRNA--protein transferase